MKPLTNDCDRYHRPVTRRYEPTEEAKNAVCTDWVDADIVARVQIEEIEWPFYPCLRPGEYIGYPTA